MFSLIIDLKNNLEAVIGIGIASGVLWRFVVLKAWRLFQRLEAAIGSNGGSSLFEQLEQVKDMFYITASLGDVIQRPMLFVSPSGEVDAVNSELTERTGLSLESLQRGGWRQLFGRDDQEDWDEIVERKSVFSRDVTLKGTQYHLTAKPVFNKTKFLGWRAVLTPHGQPLRRVGDLS